MNIFKSIKNIFSKSISGIGEIGLFQSRALRSDSLNWNTTTILKKAEVSLYTNKALGVRARKVGEIKFNVVDKRTKEESTGPEAKKILSLLNKPNSYQSKNEFFELYQKYKDMTGSVYIWLKKDNPKIEDAGTITEMELLRSDWMQQKFDKKGNLIGYIFQWPNKGEIEFKTKEIVASHYYDPLNPKVGVSLLRAGIRAVGLENQLADYQSNVLNNGGRIDGIMNFKSSQGLSKQQLEEIKESYREQYADAKKSGIPLFLGGDASYQRTQLNPEELGFITSKGVTLNDICILTEVPKIMLATVDGIKFDNAKESRRMFYQDVIAPAQKNIAIKFDTSEAFAADNFLITIEDPTPEDVDQKLKTNESGIKNYYITVNEARENVGREPIDGGDKLLIPFGVMPHEEETEESKKKIKAVKSPACRMENETKKECVSRKIPEILKENPGMERDQAIAIANSVCSHSCKIIKDFNHPLKNPKFREAYGRLKVAKEKKNEKIFIKLFNKYIKAQRDRFLEGLKDQEARMLSKDALDEWWNQEQELKIGVNVFLPFFEDIMMEAGADSMALVGSEFAFNISSDIRSWLDKKSNVFLNQINETTFNQLKNDFSESLAAGETRQQLISRIEGTYGNISKKRAATIARTEVGGVMTKGTFEAYKQANIPIKIWVTVGDARVRITHASVDGEERPLDMPFSNGLMYPREFGAPASEVVNCRCQV